jgi:hypothetical protein
MLRRAITVYGSRIRLAIVLGLSLLVGFGTAGIALAHDEQHGGTEGHLPATSENVTLVGKANVNQDQEGRIADVGVFGNYAYLGAWSHPRCQKGGVYVLDIRNPANPKQVNFIRTANDSYVGEGVQVVHIDTPKYQGDVLAMNNEICGAPNLNANGGLTLVDVSNPKVHKYLAKNVGDDDDGDGLVNQIHSVFMWDAGDKAYAVLVDDMERTDVDIMDITDPRNPKKIAEYDLRAKFPQIFQEGAGLEDVFHHDVVVKRIDGRWVMLVSYWDGGYVTLDVSDPTNARYIADSDFASPDPEAAAYGLDVHPEGNAHEAEFSADNGYIVAANEDFHPYKNVAADLTKGTKSTVTDVLAPFSPAQTLPPSERIEGESVYVGQACSGVPAGNGAGQVAVVERGGCPIQVKLDAVNAAGGYEGLVIFNWEGIERPTWNGCDILVNSGTTPFTSSIPAYFMTRRAGYELFGVPYDHAQCLAGNPDQVGANTHLAPIAVGTTGDRVGVGPEFDGWGYVHLYRNGSGKLQELDTYAIPEAFDPHYADGHGDLSVHEVAMSERDSRLAYFSYYAGGFRVARIENDRLVETGRFIDEGGNNFWGVQVWQKDGKEYVLASDRDYGLYIFEYTGP